MSSLQSQSAHQPLTNRVFYAEKVHGIFQSAKSQTQEIQSWEESALFGDYYSFIKYIKTSCFKTENLKSEEYTGINPFFFLRTEINGFRSPQSIWKAPHNMNNVFLFHCYTPAWGKVFTMQINLQKFCKCYWSFSISDQIMDWYIGKK